MVTNRTAVPIASDVLLAPHHGADNGSSTDFIRSVAPQHVAFSAGHKFEHPRARTIRRYRNCGVAVSHMFRTDRNDNEGGEEWRQSPATTPDKPGDDDVDVLLPAVSGIQVAYRLP